VISCQFLMMKIGTTDPFRRKKRKGWGRGAEGEGED